jgi:hypothetical protein
MNKRKVMTLFSGAALVLCESVHALEYRGFEGQSLTPHPRYVFDDRLPLTADLPHSHTEFPEITLNTSSSISASGQSVEGTLDLRMENSDNPTYQILFYQYDLGFKHGAQRHQIVSSDTVEALLVELIGPEAAKSTMKKIHRQAGFYISIPHVKMPKSYFDCFTK